MAKKLTPEKLQELMQVADNHASSASANSEGAVDGNKVYLETLVDEINEFFSGAVKEKAAETTNSFSSNNVQTVAYPFAKLFVR